ncbi:acyl-homoserine-lactone synthase [Sulfitobacter donghicola]|uniref:Acyl-homoserine-lactone synthase n=1 Tax=Sulfitobacter donghicola DSW-25 = KCTC 12864 = JCM 14565 TaxID=1300350 RepID=A0A073IJP9_9RHOB|nr:acyl-homoserine-lactone synthase [Sulfitobacter donghicola]KEJ89761.1 autoinducer synthase [Sulfitobacter donghicola DSW-25 = KCTC 12864 = JCM 14565]KIN67135.1 Autoinducer synthesis protein Tral [Sulfitobacter donghicola DSW-25 = KCTC 12864 = JCM 14565]
MLRYVYADQLDKFPRLAEEMFAHRADQFKTRLGWDVSVDEHGRERDEYDAMNPLYVIWETAEGGHGGSTRFLPTTGPVMVNDHFSHLTSSPICSPNIWECTRFCMAPGQGPNVAAALMLGGGELMNGFGVQHFVGVFDARMVRIYSRVGSSPEVLGSIGEGREQISVGLWEFEAEAQERVAARAGISLAQSRAWFERSFGSDSMIEFAATA